MAYRSGGPVIDQTQGHPTKTRPAEGINLLRQCPPKEFTAAHARSQPLALLDRCPSTPPRSTVSSAVTEIEDDPLSTGGSITAPLRDTDACGSEEAGINPLGQYSPTFVAASTGYEDVQLRLILPDPSRTPSPFRPPLPITPFADDSFSTGGIVTIPVDDFADAHGAREEGSTAEARCLKTKKADYKFADKQGRFKSLRVKSGSEGVIEKCDDWLERLFRSDEKSDKEEKRYGGKEQDTA